MRKRAILLMIFVLVAIFSGCQSVDNSNANDNEVMMSEQPNDVVVDTDADVTSSASIETQTTPEAEPAQYYTPTKYGTGVEFTLPVIEGFSDDTAFIQEMTYTCNRLLYGIGTYAGCYDGKDYFMAPQLITWTKDFWCDEEGDLMGVYLDLCYGVLTADSRTVTITVATEFGCDADGSFWGMPLGLMYRVEISDAPCYYTSYDGIEFYEILIGNEGAEGYYDIDTGEWTAIGATNGYENDASPSEDTLSDSTLEYEALTYLHQIAGEIKSEYRNSGYKMCTASPHASYVSIVNRTNDTVTIQGRIDIWLDGGGDPDGNVTVTLVMNRYSGALISYR